MATDLGKVGIVAKGNWNSSTSYEVLDAVSYNNGLYIAKQAVPANTAPSDTTYWQNALSYDYTSVNCDSITDLYDLVNLIYNTNVVGVGALGSSQTSNLKSLIGTPINRGAVVVYIRLLGKRSDTQMFECFASSQYNESIAMAKKYIWFSGGSHFLSQSAWENINPTT